MHTHMHTHTHTNPLVSIQLDCESVNELLGLLFLEIHDGIEHLHTNHVTW